MKKLPKFPPTETQAEIIENFKQGRNQVVIAVPGAGKTTLALLLASSLPPGSDNTLLITFSKRLRDETKTKADELGLSNMDVRTFHSIGCHYYNPNTRGDLDLSEIYSKNMPPCNPLPVDVNCVILDEAQDMCKEQFLFLYKFFQDLYCEKLHAEDDGISDTKTRLIVMGDGNQCIFPYKGADPRYLTKAEELWINHSLFREMKEGFAIPPAFQYVSMNGSNRLPGPLVEFLNFNEMCTQNQKKPLVSLKSQRLALEGGDTEIATEIATKKEKNVQYWRMKKQDMIIRILARITNLIKSKEGTPGDFFIICPSLRKNFVAKEILNDLTHLGYTCFFPNQDESDKTDDQVLMNKICFLTGHSSKGRERRFCFLLGFDSSYYQFMDREAPPSICTNLLYVACTRSTEELVVCEFYTENQTTYYQNRPQEMKYPLPFLKMTSMGMLTGEYSDFLTYFGEGNMNEEKGVVEKIEEQREERGLVKMNATDLVNFLPTVVLEKLSNRMENWWKVLESPHREISIPSVIICGGAAGSGEGVVGTQEEVSDLNGLAIPCIFMSKYFRDTPGYLYERLADRMESLEEKKKNGKHFKLLAKKMRLLPRDGMWQWSDYLLYFNLEQAFTNQVFHRLRQITEYDWLSSETVQKLVDIFAGVLGEEIADSRRKGIRPFLEYDLFSSFSTVPKKPDVVGGDVVGGEDMVGVGAIDNIPTAPIAIPGAVLRPRLEPVELSGSLDSVASSMRSYMGASIPSTNSDDTWEEIPDTPLDTEMGELLAKERAERKSMFFQDAMMGALKSLVEESPEYLAMDSALKGKRRWYEGRSFMFSGALDMVTHRSVWEMKCTSMLSKEHQLQLLLYAWFWKGLEELYEKSPESFSDKERKYIAPLGDAGYGKEFHLFNVKTREHLQLCSEVGFQELTEFVALWVDGKNNSVALSIHLSDADFLGILDEV
jgi:hypothetical protein